MNWLNGIKGVIKVCKSIDGRYERTESNLTIGRNRTFKADIDTQQLINKTIEAENKGVDWENVREWRTTW